MPTMPTWGLESGGTYDQSVAKGIYRDQTYPPAGDAQSAGERQAIQAKESLAISDAVPRGAQPAQDAAPVVAPANGGVGEQNHLEEGFKNHFMELLQKNMGNKEMLSEMRKVLNKYGIPTSLDELTSGDYPLGVAAIGKAAGQVAKNKDTSGEVQK